MKTDICHILWTYLLKRKIAQWDSASLLESNIVSMSPMEEFDQALEPS